MSVRDRWHELRQDVVYALRGLAREPHFAVMVVLTLGLGIGANAAMFGIVDRLLLRGPEHVRAPDEIVRLYLTVREPGEGDQTTWTHSYAEYVTQRDGNRAFSAVGAYAFGEGVLGRGTDTEKIRTGFGTPDFFTVLGVQALLGRFIGAEDDRPPTGERVLVLSHRLWQREFGGATSALGRELILNGERYTVIGVAPKGFTGAQLEPVEAWLPMTVRAYTTSPDWQTTWSAQWLQIIARPRADATSERIAAEATAAHRGGYVGREAVMRDARITSAPLRYNRAGKEPTEVSISRWLVGVSSIVLLIACANVANLLLVRVVRRRREIAVRVVLGVTRGRLARMLLTECLLLAGLGALAGLAVAYWSGQFVRVLLLPDVEWSSPPLALRVLVFSVLAAVVTALLIGLLPILQAARTDLSSALKTTAREGGGRRSRVRSILTMAQAALSVVLLIGAGLFMRSLWNVRHLDLGIEPERVLVVAPRYPSLAGLNPPDVQGERARRTSVLNEAVETLGRLNGIEHVSSAVGTPFYSSFTIKLRVPGFDSLPTLPGGGPYVAAVQPGYFATVGTPLLRGRAFTGADRAGSEPVAMINQTMGRTLWPGQDPIGQCMHIGHDEDPPCARIVGIVADARRLGLTEPPAMQYYVPLGQEKGIGGRNLLVRATADGEAVIPAIRAAMAKLDPSIPYVNVETLQQALDPQVRPWRLGATMFALFGGLALLIAAIGLYSVIAYLVAQRLHEFGVRLALGAGAQHIRKLIVGHGAALCLGGAAIGMLIALAAGRLLEDLLFETSPRDPSVFLTVGLTLIAVALVATALPARRATRVDPATVLRLD